MKFKKGMVLAVNVIPGCGDTPSIMIIDTAKLSSSGEQGKWLKAMKEELEKDLHPEKVGVDSGQQTFPDVWDVLEKSEIKTFPVQIDGVVNLYYENW